MQAEDVFKNQFNMKSLITDALRLIYSRVLFSGVFAKIFGKTDHKLHILGFFITVSASKGLDYNHICIHAVSEILFTLWLFGKRFLILL